MDEKALFKLSYGLFVLGSRLGEKDSGCIVNTVQQVASSPMTIAVAVNKANFTNFMIDKSGVFCVSTLTQDVPFDIFKRFGFASGKDVEKFEGYNDYDRDINNVCYLNEYCNSYISAKVINKVDLGSHTLFIAEIVEAKVLNDKPSITYDYYHKNTKPKQSAQASSTSKTQYRCSICGYVYEGEQLPEGYVCPLCKHDASYFEKV